MRYTLEDLPFAGRTGAGVTVAILDSGIHAGHPHVGPVDGGISFAESTNDLVDRIGHGTAVAAAIREKAPSVKLLAVKIFDRRLATNAAVLARGIEWAANEGAQIINLSVGTANAAHAEGLSAAVRHASSRGAIVVSARESNGVMWYPGALADVAGVSADPDCERDAIEVTLQPGALPSFRASPYPRPIPNVPRERNLSGVSFAVANVAGFLARAIESGGAVTSAALLQALAVETTEPRAAETPTSEFL